LNIEKHIQSSEPLETKLNPTSCLFGFAGAFLFFEKIHQSAVLLWFELRNIGILQIFYSRAVNQRTIVDSPSFLEHGLTGAHTNCDPNMYEFQIFNTKIKKSKTCGG
jgi:hypothetical protein